MICVCEVSRDRQLVDEGSCVKCGRLVRAPQKPSPDDLLAQLIEDAYDAKEAERRRKKREAERYRKRRRRRGERTARNMGVDPLVILEPRRSGFRKPRYAPAP